jgi:hypothetical protein
VARNKATRSRRAQTAERVRNPESGRCRGGKSAQRSPGLKRRKGPNPMGGVVEFPTLRVLHLRTTSVARWWEAPFGRTAREPNRFGVLTRNPFPESSLAGVHSFGREHPGGILRRGDVGFGQDQRVEDAPLPGFGQGEGEARCDDVACAPSRVTARRVEPRFRPTFFSAQRHIRGSVSSRTEASADVWLSAGILSPRAIRLRCRLGLVPTRQRTSAHTPSGV